MSLALPLPRLAWPSWVRRTPIRAAFLCFLLIFSAPFLVASHRYPRTVFDSEWAAACMLAFALVVAPLARPARLAVGWALPTIVLLLGGIALLQWQLGRLAYGYNLSTLSIALIALSSAYLAGRWAVAARVRRQVTQAVAAGIVAGALLQVVVQGLQLFDVRTLPPWLMFPTYADPSARRLFGNLAQPNLLATYLATGVMAAAYLAHSLVSRRILLGVAAILCCGLALTVSRMGSLFLVALIVACLVPTALAPATRRGRIVAAVVLVAGYAVGLLVVRYLLGETGTVAASALDRYGDGSIGQRASMWSDAWRIALAHPWLGTGAGEYGGAQYWMAAPHPALLATDNPHNLGLHLAAEFGLPAALVVVAIVVGWLRRRLPLLKTDRAGAFALGGVAFLLAHSLLEYPLWNLHFLVVFGVLVGLAEPDPATRSSRRVGARIVLLPLGLAALGAAAVMKVDYDTVAVAWDQFLQDRVAGRPHGQETMTSVLALKGMTFFEPQAERMYTELRPVQAMQGEGEIEISARVLGRLADVPLIERHIELLLQANRIDEVYPHIARLKVFAGPDYPIVRARIEEAIATNGDQLDPVRRALRAP